MSLKEQVYSVLVVSSAEKLNTAFKELLPESHFEPVRFVSSVNAGQRAFSGRSYDFVIVNSPLPDDTGIHFSIDCASSSGTVVLLLVRAEVYDGVRDRVTEHGVFTLSRPFPRPMILTALNWMAGMREKLRKMEKKTISFEEKMEEIRLVNRAKLLLVSQLQMDEPQAHRYIEKQAMDRSVTRKTIAEEIIRLYS